MKRTTNHSALQYNTIEYPAEEEEVEESIMGFFIVRSVSLRSWCEIRVHKGTKVQFFTRHINWSKTRQILTVLELLVALVLFSSAHSRCLL